MKNRPTKTELVAKTKAAEAALRATLSKAFGDDHEYHIKESGPSWVNSPKRTPGEELVNPILKRELIVTVGEVKMAKRPTRVRKAPPTK